MNLNEFADKLDKWGNERVPFLFAVDFEQQHPFACRLDEIDSHHILVEVPGYSNVSPEPSAHSLEIIKRPVPLSAYSRKFEQVADRLSCGDSFLTNLTIKTEITTNQSLRELFFLAKARYKMLFGNRFLVFSPETFVRIAEGKIYTFPMKGTIDAALPNAGRTILEDPKELAEHVTIVDLMRNDLSRVATGVFVSRFRYLEELKTNHKNLLQVSSEIVGRLPHDYASKLGTILLELLPAGSVSGAPKVKTMEIIHDAEGEPRGYYTGVFGYFDGEKFDSAVMIRFIEKVGDRLFYRSGGGITTQSNMEQEYQEAIDKIYVPVD